MSKSIYEEALKESKDFGSFVGLKLDKVNNALEQAQKQYRLLELYRKLDDCIVAPNGHHVCRYTDDEKYARIRKQIKELEVKQKKDKEQE